MLLQVTFCPDVPTKAADNVQLLKLPNLQLPLYTHSFLGFGQEAALTLASTAAVSKMLQATTTTPSNTSRIKWLGREHLYCSAGYMYPVVQCRLSQSPSASLQACTSRE